MDPSCTARAMNNGDPIAWEDRDSGSLDEVLVDGIGASHERNAAYEVIKPGLVRQFDAVSGSGRTGAAF